MVVVAIVIVPTRPSVRMTRSAETWANSIGSPRSSTMRPEMAALRGRRTSALNAGDSPVISIHIGGSAALCDPKRVCA